MKFKLDENLGRSAFDILQGNAHDVQTVRGQGLSTATDREIDPLVYELYGLTDEEIKIVEEATGC